jgi:hypothetical protein
MCPNYPINVIQSGPEAPHDHPVPNQLSDMLSASTLELNLPKKLSSHKSLAKSSAERNRKAYKSDFSTFRTNYPQYDRTTSLDILRKTEFSRIEKASEVYVDYMGGGLWPECLVAAHSAILQAGLFGNTHSDSPS